LLSVDILSLDIATRTISARLSLIFNNELVHELWITSASHPQRMPLTKVPHDVWARMPVDIQLIPCGEIIGSSRCPPIATIPLGRLDLSGVGGSGSVQAPMTLPILGWPNRFPSDLYVLSTAPEIFLPKNVSLVTQATSSAATVFTVVPVRTVITTDYGIGDHTLTAVEGSMTHSRFLVVGLLIGRGILYRITIYGVALLPLLLGAVVAHGSARHAATKGSPGPGFDPVVIGGLIVAMLAILPLRAVLVPTDLNAAGLTLVDYILVLDFLCIAAFIFFQYARFVTMPEQTDGPNPSAEGRGTEAQ
jgi:hypothetical protein